MEARAYAAEDILRRLVGHYRAGETTIKGAATGTWNRALKLVEVLDDSDGDRPGSD